MTILAESMFQQYNDFPGEKYTGLYRGEPDPLLLAIHQSVWVLLLLRN